MTVYDVTTPGSECFRLLERAGPLEARWAEKRRRADADANASTTPPPPPALGELALAHVEEPTLGSDAVSVFRASARAANALVIVMEGRAADAEARLVEARAAAAARVAEAEAAGAAAVAAAAAAADEAGRSLARAEAARSAAAEKCLHAVAGDAARRASAAAAATRSTAAAPGDVDDRDCAVCFDARPACLLLPCKHIRCCAACVARLRAPRLCPVCRALVVEVIDVFV